MSETTTLILIITSIVTFIASIVLMFFYEKIGLPVSEWLIFIFISFIIAVSQIIKILSPGFDLSSTFILLSISIAIFVIVVMNYWELLSEYNIIYKAKK